MFRLPGEPGQELLGEAARARRDARRAVLGVGFADGEHPRFALQHVVERGAWRREGQAVERADNTARLLDVKYHLLLPEGEQVGGVVDRDQWTTILQTVSAVTAYRWLYSEGLRPANVIATTHTIR